MTQTDYEAVWGALPTPALIVSDELVITTINPAAESFFGQSSKQISGHKLEAFVGEASRIIDVVKQVLEKSASLVQYDVEFSWRDKSRRLNTLQAVRMSAPDRGVLLLLTPRGLAEKMDRSLSSRNAARSVTGMAAMLAHEIRNPLAGISGAAQLLAMTQDDADREITALIETEIERIGELVNRVEQFGDMRAIDRKPVNIHDIIDRSVRLARAGFASHIRLNEVYDPSLPLTHGDSDQLMQVMQNLLKNAAEAAPKVGGVVTVKTSFRPGVRLTVPGARAAGLPLEILVIDNGEGIPDDLIKDIFDPFVTTKSNGSGLGLSLVSKVLNDHGGVIECESEPGRTEFRVLLPVFGNSDTGGEA